MQYAFGRQFIVQRSGVSFCDVIIKTAGKWPLSFPLCGLDVVEAFYLIPNLEGYPRKVSRQADTVDGDHAHVADGFADDGKRVVSDFTVRHQVARPDEVMWINIAL